jgi:hypothetical protein
MAQPEGEGGAGLKATLTRKYGPLPLWVWLGLALAGALLWARMRAAKATADAAAQTDSSANPPDTTPAPIYQNYVTFTGPATPPAGGRTEPPPVPPNGPGGGATGGSGTGTAPHPGTPPPPKPGPSPVPSPAPRQTVVTVARYTSQNPPWNSTLSGIAQHEGYGSNWQAIWNAPANAALKARRKRPDLIQPRDKIVVPAK